MTINLDERLLSRAADLTGIQQRTKLVRMGLEALIARESAARLGALAGTEKMLRPIHRRRSASQRSAAMKGKTIWLDDPVVREVREARQRLWEQAGGTIGGLVELLDRMLPELSKPDPAKRRVKRVAGKKR